MATRTRIRHAPTSFLTQFKPGNKAKMTVERIDGALTVVALQRVT